MSVKVYFEADQEGEWFQGLTKPSLKSRYIKLNPYGRNPERIDSLLSYDGPDIILTIDDVPKLVIEKTEEVPTGHNVGQRFARLVKAAEEGVMSIFFLPFKAMKHGKYKNVCYINARILKAMLNVSLVHEVPQLAIEWISDDYHELIRTGSENMWLKQLITELFSSDFNYRNDTIDTSFRNMEKAFTDAVDRHPNYNSPPPSVSIITTNKFINVFYETLKDIKLPNYFHQRTDTLVYQIGMTEKACRREDPFVGTQFIYDYIYCGRYGPTIKDRKRNLTLHFPKIRKSVWLQRNPYNPRLKRRLWYLVPDLLIFQDGTIYPERTIWDYNQKQIKLS